MSATALEVVNVDFDDVPFQAGAVRCPDQLTNFGAELGIKEFVDLFWRRKADPKVKLPKAMEAAFSANPELPSSTCDSEHEGSMSKASTLARPRPTRNDAQRQAILDAASLLFIEKGFGGTNINDIADAVGTTRTALYYYFPSKESMLEALTEEVTEKASALAKSVSGRDELPADEALRLLILQHAGLILSHPVQFRVVERSESSLPEPHRSAAQSARRAVLDHFVRVIQRGIDGGQFRRGADARIAAFSIIGMCNWSAWWFDPAGNVPADTVAATIVDFGLRMLLPDKPRRARAASMEDAVGQMREALEVFESQLERPRGH